MRIIDYRRITSQLEKKKAFYVRNSKKTIFKSFDRDEWMTPWAIKSHEMQVVDTITRKNAETSTKR